MSSQPERCQTVNHSPIAHPVSARPVLSHRRCRSVVVEAGGARSGQHHAASSARRTFQIPSFCFPFLQHSELRLPLGRPDVLDKAIALSQAVESIVGLTHGADEAAQGVDVVLAVDLAAGLVNLGDGDLDGAVVLGLDDAVGGRALAGDVAVWERGAESVHDLCVWFGLREQ